VKSSEVPLIDIHETFAAQDDPLALFQLRLPSHYTQKGHRLVADAVLKTINRSN
jgi:hypothetical protein